jgi:uncharacterized protein YggU (UPF0235/DUF167 family)
MCVSIAVKVQPGARRAGVLGRVDAEAGPRLKIAVRAKPVDGAANRAVCAALAELLDVPVSAVNVLQGAASRQKILTVSGDPAMLTGRLEAL